MAPWIELKDVRKSFGARDLRAGVHAYAVDGVDLRIERGQFVTLLGSSGCGKTTTLRMIAGLEVPSSGSIFYKGEDITDVPATDRDMRMVFQDYALFPNLSVAENIVFGLRLRRMRGRFSEMEIAHRLEEFLGLVHLTEHAGKMPHQLSGGQKQRVALSRALITDPAVVLFDEPLGSLDAGLRKVMQVELIRIQRQLGKTFIYVTHDQDEAMAMSDVIAVMKDGKVLQMGSPQEIYARPNCRYVASFIGQANVLDGTVEQVADSQASIRLANGQRIMAPANGTTAVGRRVGLVMRADDFQFADRADSNGDGNWLTGRLTDALFRGNRMEYVIDLSDSVGTINVYDHDASRPLVEIGQPIKIGIEPAAVRVLPD